VWLIHVPLNARSLECASHWCLKNTKPVLQSFYCPIYNVRYVLNFPKTFCYYIKNNRLPQYLSSPYTHLFSTPLYRFSAPFVPIILLSLHLNIWIPYSKTLLIVECFIFYEYTLFTLSYFRGILKYIMTHKVLKTMPKNY
jgi:hypothetical protein